MSAQHSLGPWKYGKTLSSTSGEWLVSLDITGQIGNPVAEVIPATGNELENARLISAAPELLAALQAVRRDMHEFKFGFELLWDEADAAIAKATGSAA